MYVKKLSDFFRCCACLSSPSYLIYLIYISKRMNDTIHEVLYPFFLLPSFERTILLPIFPLEDPNGVCFPYVLPRCALFTDCRCGGGIILPAAPQTKKQNEKTKKIKYIIWDFKNPFADEKTPKKNVRASSISERAAWHSYKITPPTDVITAHRLGLYLSRVSLRTSPSAQINVLGSDNCRQA